MISAADISGAMALRPAHVLPMAAAPATGRERLLGRVLLVTMFLSCIAIIEPSPHDFMMGLLLLACLYAGVTFERLLAPLFLLLVIWNIGGLIALFNVVDNPKAITYAGITFYLSVAALIFGCLFAKNTLHRLEIVRRAYIAGAFLTAVAGIVGYFQVSARTSEMFTLYDRATGFFKDPNVFGPFLIWPALIIVARMLTARITLRDSAVLGVILSGLFLSLSRGAWMHFLVSGGVLLALLFITASDERFRVKLVGMSVIGVFALCALLVALLSIPAVSKLFLERANVVNYYDVGEGGRFVLQEQALRTLLDFPAGMGALEFARVFGLQQHNVYLQAFIVYGWAGGVAYVMFVILTLLLGLRTALTRTPWQMYAIVTFAVFVGEVGEGGVIDTDHWRHFFLLVGMIWGMAAATRQLSQQRRLAPAAAPVTP